MTQGVRAGRVLGNGGRHARTERYRGRHRKAGGQIGLGTGVRVAAVVACAALFVCLPQPSWADRAGMGAGAAHATAQSLVTAQNPMTAQSLVTATNPMTATSLVTAQSLVTATNPMTAQSLVTATNLVRAQSLVSAQNLVTVKGLPGLLRLRFTRLG